MLSFEPSGFRQAVSTPVLDALYQMLNQFADDLETETHVITEDWLTSTGEATEQGGDRFIALVSKPFSVLLVATPMQAHPAAPNAATILDTPSHALAQGSTDAISWPSYARTAYWLDMTFEPNPIAAYLSQMTSLMTPVTRLRRMLNQLHHASMGTNDATLQRRFTLALIHQLSPLRESSSQLEAPQVLLNQSILERTQELKDAMMAAEAASRAKSEFLSAMSHELRTPLTYIIGMSATLMRGSFDELKNISKQKQKGYLQTIHDRGEHLLELINNILDLSQLESGKAILNLQEFSPSRLLQQCIKDCEANAAQKLITLTLNLRLSAESDRLVADQRRVRQILLNLLNNAIKFTPEQGNVTLSASAFDQWVVFQVKDTGIGISEQQRSLIFEKFQQLDSSYQRQYGGAGLGLALTRQLVELHGGWIDFDSTVGVGTLFTVHLPKTAHKADKIATEVDTVGLPNYPRGQIVLVESHDESAHLVIDMLTAAGYQLVWLLDGAMAIEQIDILQPIVVMTAMQLPDMDGGELMQLLRQNPSTQRLKIIALADAHIAEQQSIAAQADEVLLKPIQPDELMCKVDRLVRQRAVTKD